MPSTPQLSSTVRRFIEDVGNTTQSFGIGRVVGQIYAYLYFSPQPRNLNDLQESLGISKGSASMSVRQLEQWGAVRKVWIKGDRKDYYEANDWFGKILKSVVIDAVAQKLQAYTTLLDRAEDELETNDTANDDKKFIKDRIQHLKKFHNRAKKVWENPLLQRLIK
jgi:DNA-binding transcriptional regulator GbsR (MarR family)